MKILLLHGFCQNSSVFSLKISVLRKLLVKNKIDLVFGNGRTIVGEDKERPDNALVTDRSQRGWWNANDCNYIGFDKSLEYLKKLSLESNGFDGILGFSQGATMAALVASELKPKFLILISGFVPRDQDLLKNLEYGGKILHVIGQNDELVKPESSLELAEFFRRRHPHNSTILMHEGGHLVPQKSASKTEIFSWLQQFI